MSDEKIPAADSGEQESTAPALPTAEGGANADDPEADLKYLLPEVVIEIGEDGDPIAPESCKPYEATFKTPGVTAAYAAVATKSVITVYADQIRSFLDSGLSPDSEQVKEAAQTLAELKAFIAAYLGNDQDGEIAHVQQVLEHAKQQAAEAEAKLAAMEGTEEEKQTRLQRERMKKYGARNPFKEGLSSRFKHLVDLCLEYCPPKFETDVCAELGEASSSPQPLLRHFILNYIDGKEAFCEDLQSETVLGTLSEDLCDQFRKLVQEVSDPVRFEGKPFCEVRRAVLLVATFLASASQTAYMSKWSSEKRAAFDASKNDDNFHATQAVVRTVTESITARLNSLEAAMRESGDYAKLEALVKPATKLPNATESEDASSGSHDLLRQDLPNMLGQHPEFLQLEEAFRKQPIGYPGHSPDMRRNHMIYLWTEPPQLLECLDDDMQFMIRGYLEMMTSVANAFKYSTVALADVKAARILESCSVQPYTLWLLKMARRVAPPFAVAMKQHFADDCFEYQEAPVKGFLRCSEKVKEKYVPV